MTRTRVPPEQCVKAGGAHPQLSGTHRQTTLRCSFMKFVRQDLHESPPKRHMRKMHASHQRSPSQTRSIVAGSGVRMHTVAQNPIITLEDGSTEAHASGSAPMKAEMLRQCKRNNKPQVTMFTLITE